MLSSSSYMCKMKFKSSMNLIQVYHFRFHIIIIMCIEYKLEIYFFISTFHPALKEFRLVPLAQKIPFSVYYYMAHIIWESNRYHYLNENHSFAMHEFISFHFAPFFDNNRNIILILCRAEKKAKTRTCSRYHVVLFRHENFPLSHSLWNT